MCFASFGCDDEGGGFCVFEWFDKRVLYPVRLAYLPRTPKEKVVQSAGEIVRNEEGESIVCWTAAVRNRLRLLLPGGAFLFR